MWSTLFFITLVLSSALVIHGDDSDDDEFMINYIKPMDESYVKPYLMDDEREVEQTVEWKLGVRSKRPIIIV